MWPWEHLAVGYLVYAAGRRLRTGRRPAAAAVYALALATQLPDLVDKPLAWVLGVLPSGTSLAHSVLFATPLTALVGALAAWRGRPDVAAAFGAGYAAHLLGDVVYPVFLGGELSPEKVLWPLAPPGTSGSVSRIAALAADFAGFLSTPRGQLYLLGELLLLGVALLWWVFDGAPGLGFVRRPAGR